MCYLSGLTCVCVELTQTRFISNSLINILYFYFYLFYYLDNWKIGDLPLNVLFGEHLDMINLHTF